MGRDRSQGWVHAKRSGHEFEDAFARHVLEPASKERKALISFLQEAGIDQHPVSADGRIGRARVADWTGRGRTTPKRDVTVVLEGGRQLGISLKKPSTRSGQAFLCQYDRFSACVGSRSVGVAKPDGVDWVFHGVLGLTGGKNIASWQPGIKFHSPVRKTHGVSYEEYQNRLYFSTVRSECPDKWREFIDWFRGNLGVITDMALASGFCGTAGHSDIIYLGCEGAFVWTAALVAESRDRAALATPSTGGRFPGSTLELPWGFLQVHRPGKKSGPFQLQFHWQSKAEAWRAAIGKPPIRARG